MTDICSGSVLLIVLATDVSSVLVCSLVTIYLQGKNSTVNFGALHTCTRGKNASQRQNQQAREELKASVEKGR